MGALNSRIMDDSDSLSMSDDNYSEYDFANLLQYYITSGQAQILSLDEDIRHFMPVQPYNGIPDTEVLDQSEIKVMTQFAAGLKHKKGQQRPKSITAMICERERGMYGNLSFTKGDRCKISNTFLPNTCTNVGSFQAKIFCGTYLDSGNLFLSASQDRFLRLFDTRGKNFKLLRTIPARDVGWSILDVAVSPDGKHIAYSSWCDCLQLCSLTGDIEEQESLLLCPEEKRFCVFSLKFSADGKEILCGANDGYIYVYDRQSQQRAFRIVGHDNDVNAVAFADTRSEILYSGGDDGICKVWDRRTLREWDPKPVGSLAGHMDGITFIEPQGDGRHLLTNSKDQSIKLWDVRNFSTKLGLKNTRIAVSIRNWDYRWHEVPKGLRNPKKRLEGDTSIMTYCGHSVLQTLCRCYFSPEHTTGQRYIYTGCAGGRVIIYDLLTGKVIRRLTGHTNCVRDVAWHPYRNEIISTSWDGNIIRWYYKETKDLIDSDYEDNGEEGCHNNLNKKKVISRPTRRSQRIADQRLRWALENESADEP